MENKFVSIEDIVCELKNTEQENTVRMLKNACVSAGAGSGKTKVLATRYVYLVAKYGYMPSEILTLTFTNKAANEMYSRIYKSLVEYSERITEPKELANIKKAINEFQESKIQTLDSYCKALVSTNIHKFGISPDFSLDGKELENAVKQKAVEFLLKNRKNPYLQFFMKTKNPESFAKEFFVDIVLYNSTICKPLDFEGDIEKQLSIVKDEWKKYAKEANQLLVDVKSAFEEFGNNGTASVKAKLQELWDKIDTVECEEYPDLLKETEILENWYKWFYDFKCLDKRYVKELKPFVEDARNLHDKMMPCFNYIFYQDELRGIAKLLSQFQTEVENIKRGMGLLSFNDVATLGIESLLKYPEIRNMEKKAYKAIMIDEFQDDNQLQKELLFLLSEREDLYSQTVPTAAELNPEKLFFVGDEKQSIYKFRGADVEVFRKLSTELEGKATLSTNYRSEPALVAGFNALFGGVDYPLASEADIEGFKNADKSELDCSSGVFKENLPGLEDFEACYTLTKAAPKKLENPDYSPRMHFVLMETSSNDSVDKELFYTEKESEAYFVAKKIRELLDSKVYKESEIALLFRSATHQHVYERFLKYFGIPYSCGKQKSFFYDAPINDMIALLRVALYQDDLLSIMAFLSSPYVRLSSDAVNQIVSVLSNQKKTQRYFKNPFDDEEFDKIKAGLPISQQEKFENAKNLIQELRVFIKNHSIAEIISKIFVDFGYRFETMWNNSVGIYSELYDFLFAFAKESDACEESLGDFLMNLDNMKNNPREMDDISIPLERGNAVQIMTIHASKGLEFPCVFVVGIGDDPKSVSSDGIACYNEENGVALNLPLHPMLDKGTSKNIFFDKIKEDQQNKENAEARRVLYVAITRAEKELYLTGKVCKSDSKAKAFNFYRLLSPSIEKYVTFDNEISVDKNSPFTYEEMSLVEKASSQEAAQNINNSENREILVSKNATAYENAEIEILPIIPTNKFNPSDEKVAEILFGENPQCINPEKYAQNQPLFEKLETDKIIESEVSKKGKTQGFNNPNFGTIAHGYIEHYFKERDNAEKSEPQIPAVIVEKLSPRVFETVKSDAKLLAQGFMKSELGQKAYNSTWYKNEYDFKFAMKINGKVSIIDGQIDLVFKDEKTGKFVVVDFKSDSAINPNDHISQLALYKKATAALCNVDESKVETYLFYLRFGVTVNLDEYLV